MVQRRCSKGQGGGPVTGPGAAGKFPVGTESEEPTHFLLLCEALGPEEAWTEPAFLAAGYREGTRGTLPEEEEGSESVPPDAFSAGPSLLCPRACACTWLLPSTGKWN